MCTNELCLPRGAWQLCVPVRNCVVLRLWFLSSAFRPLTPAGGSGGQFMIWLWCYNTIGLQWCCSSSLTLLAPPTGPLLPTLVLLLCLLGSAPPPPVAVRQCMGDPWGDGDHGSPFQNGQSPCVLCRRTFLSLPVGRVCLGVRGREVWAVTDGEAMRHLTPFLLCEPVRNTNIKLDVRQRSYRQLGFYFSGKCVRIGQNLTRVVKKPRLTKRLCPDFTDTAALIDQVFIDSLIGSNEISFKKKERIQTLLFKLNYFVFRARWRKQSHYKLSDVSAETDLKCQQEYVTSPTSK